MIHFFYLRASSMDLLPHIPTENPWIPPRRAGAWQHECEVRPRHCTAAPGSWRDKNTKAHRFKIIYTPVFIDLKYINGFQSNAFVMKQKTEPNFPEPWLRAISCSQLEQVCPCQMCWFCAGAPNPSAPVLAQRGSTCASTQTSPGPGESEFYGLKAAEMMISITT